MGNRGEHYIKSGAFLALLILFIHQAFSQGVIRGQVIDADTREGVSSATLVNDSLKRGTSTDSLGYFQLSLPQGSSSVFVECKALGYQSKFVKLTKEGGFLRIGIHKESQHIENVEVIGKRKYRNRNNPAVELIDQVIKHKYLNRLHSKKAIQYHQYDKTKVGLMVGAEQKKKKLGSADFFFQNIDTLTVEGKSLLPVFLKENVSHVYAQKDPAKNKKVVLQENETVYDPRYINNPNIQAFIENVFQPVDIYEESFYLVKKLFLSPIADNGKLYYKYYIQDTLLVEGLPYIQLYFTPRNKTDLLLQGNLQISMDGSYAVKKASFEIGEGINLNFVNNLQIKLDYSPNAEGTMLLDRSYVYASFGLGRSEAMYGERTSVNYDYDLSSKIDRQVFSGPPVEIAVDIDSINKEDRPIPLSDVELSTYRNVDSLNNLRSFRNLAALGYLLAQGYYNLNKVELGPLEYLYSQNNIEGQRLRVGGRSTAALSEKIYLEGYLAYGFRDEQVKYNLRGAFSLNGKNVSHFPAHYLEATVQKDIFEPGKNLGFRKGDSFFQSFKKNKPTKWLDTDAYRLGHVVEFGNHISVHTSFLHQRRYPLGDMRFVSSADTLRLLPNMHTNEAEVTLRWAPYEQFYYRNLERRSIVDRYPVMAATYKKSLSGFWGADYSYDKLAFAIGNRFFLNQLGFFDIAVETGKYWGTLPYPLLEIPNYAEEANRYSVSYDLLNQMEFVADQYIAFSMDHQLQGFLLNKIPLIKKLKLRELWGIKGFYGKLSDHNNPQLSDDVIEFEKDNEGRNMTHSLDNTPYAEGYIGIDNILRILRVQYVKRLNYKNVPDIVDDKIRLTIHLTF